MRHKQHPARNDLFENRASSYFPKKQLVKHLRKKSFLKCFFFNDLKIKIKIICISKINFFCLIQSCLCTLKTTVLQKIVLLHCRINALSSLIVVNSFIISRVKINFSFCNQLFGSRKLFYLTLRVSLHF